MATFPMKAFWNRKFRRCDIFYVAFYLPWIVTRTWIVFIQNYFTFSVIIIYQHQAQDSGQFLATNKLSTNKAICLKTKKDK